jgi:UDP-3-O-[3-hydroxymyristoyl] glucosamine N-acyltransferase
MITLEKLAQQFQLTLRGDPGLVITGVATLRHATNNQLSFFANPKYRGELRESRAGAVLIKAGDTPDCIGAQLITENPYADFARIAYLFERVEPMIAGIHPSAVIHPSARVDPTAQVGPFVSIGPRTVVGPSVLIGPHCVIGEDCSVEANGRLIANVNLVKRVQLGRRVIVHPGAVIGADGFGLAPNASGWIKIPQLGGVIIGDDCEIGANTTIDCGALDNTVLENDVRLDNQIQIGHNVHVGAHTAMAGQVAVAGSTRIGARCLIGGGAGIVGHIELCDGTTIGARALVTHSILQPGEYASGTPLMDNRAWRKNAVRFKQLDDLFRRLQSLENKTKP